MPNWVYNSLTIEGEPALIAKVKEQLNKPFQQKHDRYNMEKGVMEQVDTLYPNPIFAFYNIYNHLQDGVSEYEYLSQDTDTKNIKNILAFEGNNWYDWNVRNWGTKWDVAVSHEEEYPDTELLEEDETTLAYKFNTAWSPPTEAIEKLSAQYPKLHFNLSYEEETGWGGEVDFLAGEGTEVETYGWKCRECDNIEEDTPYCETCEFDMCPACGYGEPDDDLREQCEEHNESATTN